jgi:glycosyltransferase involved in cell wall biosynthesis
LQPRKQQVAAIYSRGEPGLCYLWKEIARHRSIRGYWGANWMDLCQLAAGRQRADTFFPLPLPLVPVLDRGSIGFFGPWLQSRADTFILTSPYHATLLPYLASRRVIYYAFDNYNVNTPQSGLDATKCEMESRILRVANKVVVVTEALGKALTERVPQIAGRLVVSPNAVPADWIPNACPDRPAPLPPSLNNLSRPIAGVLGSISGRLRLDWLCDVVERTPFLNWLFAGIIEKGELAASDYAFLSRLRNHPRCLFTGYVTYDDYQSYASSLDVAVMPYSAQSVNPFGSPMRFYAHLPFGQPILATPGVATLENFSPLVRMCRSAKELADTLISLHAKRFDDGLRRARWHEAKRNSWAVRAQRLIEELAL